MIACVRNFVSVWLLLLVVMSTGCQCYSLPDIEDTTTTTTTTTTTEDPCGVDCATIATPECTVAVCNTGQVVGPLNTCVVIPASDGAACDDGKFCTINDSCKNGVCTGGGTSTCGMKTSPCDSVICYEDSKTCDVTPVNDGTSCTPENLCEVNGVCVLGKCKGVPKDCSFSPLAECNKVGCEQATGKCVGVPDPMKDDAPCALTGNLCNVNRTCKTGLCQGGTPKDCSAMNVGCQVGVCDSENGACGAAPAPTGTMCTEGLSECEVGACNNKGNCVPSQAPDGVSCNDHNACTKSDECKIGACGGQAVAGCSHYLNEGFESCPNGWTFGGDWQCGTPEDVGPLEAHTGKGVIATQIEGVYHVNQSFNTAVADSPLIDLTQATNPTLSFWAWVHTEGATFDGWNLKISTDGGQSFSTVTGVTPPYDLTITNQPAWGGNHSLSGWQLHTADLTPYIGHQVKLRFAFRSDGASVYPGVYIDDVVVAEPLQSPLFITTPSLPDVFAEKAFSTQLTKSGGTGSSVWSKLPGGLNDGWLSIAPETGVLSGTPSPAEVGPVTVTIRVHEPALPSNVMDKTYSFQVKQAAYFTSFEDGCPDGWTLTGDWQCGTPTSVGPAAAFFGSQCIGTQLAGLYSDLQTFAGTTATSPEINLSGMIAPKATFRMWVHTEGASYDGVNLKVSSDGGMNYAVLTSVTPAYPLTIEGEPAWGGPQSALGWQLMEADLSAYGGQIVRLRFSFQSDSSGTFPGVYIDEILVN